MNTCKNSSMLFTPLDVNGQLFAAGDLDIFGLQFTKIDGWFFVLEPSFIYKIFPISHFKTIIPFLFHIVSTEF